jgi:hypothetical protein
MMFPAAFGEGRGYATDAGCTVRGVERERQVFNLLAARWHTNCRAYATNALQTQAPSSGCGRRIY